MGCSGSRDKLQGAEKPLDHWIEPVGMEGLDATFENASKIIATIEDKRKAIVDEIEDIYGHSGTVAWKNRDLGKAFKAVVWKLGVDNDGKVSDIGFNSETHVFEGKKNSPIGNKAGNMLVNYVKNVTDEWKLEDLTNILADIEAISNDLSNNLDNYAKEVTDKFSSSPFEGIKKVAALKRNISKCTTAVASLKDIIERLKTLIGSGPSILASLNPENMQKESEFSEKAFKNKWSNPAQICWNLIEKPEDKNGKKWDDCQKEYTQKFNARQEILLKYAKNAK